MFVIAHRGGAGLAPENTLKALTTGIASGADALECDVRITKDKKIILCHDDTLLRIAGKNKKISDLTLKEICLTPTNSGAPIPTLSEALDTAKNIPLVIEAKGNNWAKLLADSITTSTLSSFHGNLVGSFCAVTGIAMSSTIICVSSDETLCA